MGGVKDIAAWARVGSRHHGDHIVGFIVPHPAGDVRLETDGQLHRLESALARRINHLIRVHARCREELVGNVDLYPTGGAKSGKRIAAEVGHLGRFGVEQDFPPIACEVSAMNDQDTQRAPAGRFFELIGPSAVVGESLTVEKMIVIRWRLVDDDEQDFAL